MKSPTSPISTALLGCYQPKEIDIGGGFAFPRDPFNAVTDYTEPAQLTALHTITKALKAFAPDLRYKVIARIVDIISMRPNHKMAPTIEQYAQACTRTLREELPKHEIDTKGMILQVEPSQAMHGNTGIHLTRVMAIKHITEPIRWNEVIVDSTEFWFTRGRYKHNLHDYIFANKADAKLDDMADINGRSCFGDRLMPTIPIPKNVAAGDIFAMFDSGAYQKVSMSQFNALPRTATLLTRGRLFGDDSDGGIRGTGRFWDLRRACHILGIHLRIQEGGLNKFMESTISPAFDRRRPYIM